MPPKAKFTREDIISAAYSLMERKGMDAVVAREVGRELGSTVAPIFTCFENMEELKAAVHEKAIEECQGYLRDFSDYFPAFKEFGLRWVHLAQEYPHVYSEIFIRKNRSASNHLFNDDLWQILEPVRVEIVRTFSLKEADADLVMKDMLIYVHGIATMLINGQIEMTEEELRISLSKQALSYVAGCRIREGLVQDKELSMMFQHLDLIPRKKTEMGGIPHELSQ